MKTSTRPSRIAANAKSDPFGPAPTAAEQLRRWDAGETIWSCEMGGLGPGYEQAIQILAMEIVRDNLDKPLPAYGSKEIEEWGYSTAERIDQKQPDGSYSCGGFSGAQVGAARNLAFKWIEYGPAKMHEITPDDRKIQVSRGFPKAPLSPKPRTGSADETEKEKGGNS